MVVCNSDNFLQPPLACSKGWWPNAECLLVRAAT